VAILSFLKWMFSTPVDPARSAQYVALAQQCPYYARNRALSYLKKAIKFDPANIEAKRNLAQMLLQPDYKADESKARAIPVLNELVALERSNPEYLLMRAKAYRESDEPGSIDRALADLSASIAIDPTFEMQGGRCDAFKERADIYRRALKNPDAAIAELDKAMEHCPNDGALYDMRALLREERGDLDGAIADRGEYIRLNPAQHAYRSRGLTFLCKGEPDLAIADFTAAIEIDPEWGPYEERGKAYEQTGDLVAALADYERQGALRGQPLAGNLYSWAESYRRVKALLDKQ
jgi:tetratricopeptide (TPR) repeat protein